MADEKERDELDELASKFIIRHKRLSKRQREILSRIDRLKADERTLENRRQRIINLINVMYKEVANEVE